MQTDRATVVEWLVETGDSVTAGEPIAVIETEKATAEVETNAGGTIRQQFVGVGETAKPTDALALVADTDEDIDELLARADVEEPAVSDSGAGDDASERCSSAGEHSTPDNRRATPRARRRAHELAVDVGAVDGSGPSGEIFAGDVEATADRADEPRSRTLRGERELSGMRRTIAERVGASYREAPHVTEHVTADVEELLDAREQAAGIIDADLSVTDMLLIALSATLETHPAFNATFENGTHRLYEEHHVCIAVDVDGGLVTPVLDNVGNRSLEELSNARQALVNRTLDGEYSSDDLEGGTFTVTNLGPYGVESFDPIINPPQVAILGLGQIVQRAVPTDENRVTFRTSLPLSLSFDHRVIDGADAARFLATLVDHLENPWPLLPAHVSDTSAPQTTFEQPDRQIRARTEGGFAGTVTAGSTEWTYDEPASVGGGGTAPTPVDMFLGSLAACLSASISFQAGKRDVSLEAVDVDVTGRPEHGPLESIEVALTLDAASATDDTLQRLVEIGERGCYVTDLLRDDVPVTLDWVRA